MFQLKSSNKSKIFSALPWVISLCLIAWYVNSILNSVSSPTVPSSTSYNEWAVENTTSPFVVWGANLKDIVIDEDCKGWICNGKSLHNYDPEIWKLIGEGGFGKSVFTFQQPMDTFIIASKDSIGFDALSGITIDGEKVSFGYLPDGTFAIPYIDGDNMPLVFKIWSNNSENKTFSEPCGIIDPNPDGDTNFSLTLGAGIIMWNFSELSSSANEISFDKIYSLTSLSIVAQPASKINSSQKCP